MSKTRTQLFWSLAFLAGSISLWLNVAPNFEQNPATEAPQAQVQTIQNENSNFVVEGVWNQYSVNSTGHRSFMAQLDIQGQGSSYIAAPSSVAPNVYPKHAYRSFDHSFNNGVWTFKEEWQQGNIGSFTLTLQEDGSFRGIAESLDDGHKFETVFARTRRCSSQQGCTR